MGVGEPDLADAAQRQFFDYAGPLFSVIVSPAASTIPVTERRRFRALPRDRSHRRVTDDLSFAWEIAEGDGSISATADQQVEFTATPTPGLVRLYVKELVLKLERMIELSLYAEEKLKAG